MTTTETTATPLVGQSLDDLCRLMQERGEKPFRGKQLAQWVYEKGARSYDEMTNLSKELRAALALGQPLTAIEVVRVDRAEDLTQKVLFQLHDGKTIEGVLMKHEGRWTMCVSSQAGCALRCSFCVTGTLGLKRNLTAGEIVDQVLWGRRLLEEAHPGERLTNLVYMGMGEPLLNVDSVIESLRLLTAPNAVGFSPRRITVSTAGVVPGIEARAAADLGVNLALSLNATTQEERATIMPHGERWPLRDVLEAMGRFPLGNRRRLTLEYVLLEGVNDTPADARRLVKIARRLPCKINLIPFNEAEALPYTRPTQEAIDHFRGILLNEKVRASVRYSKGRDIGAACGQLAAARRAA